MKKATTVASVMAFGAALLLWHLVEVYVVYSESMQPTLDSGDIVLCQKKMKIHYGDLVVFKQEKYKNQNTGIKRVIALPGDDVVYLNKTLFINSIEAKKTLVGKLKSDNMNDLLYSQTLFDASFSIHESYFGKKHTVRINSLDSYFLMGDNRDQSTDSRHFGLIPETSIICKVFVSLNGKSWKKF
ncbi:signal peptidase I [Exilibacterium tricleocarpae]|uniref:Signal peptidase I n=1 Tax=Exilibacterium tricleocarpae TaxID=2591008 RepID=A0A545SZ43_9GAMM|nr:signal peptidase I [Exilibacterium tricleocarpae]TQV70211.1 signal peptidase I [Exilibacterium tricleocarpae]